MDLRKTMKALCSECGPSGFEGKVAEKAVELIAPLCDETWIDKMGNAWGVKRCGKENAKKALLTAHLDEIGLIVTGHEDGFLRFAKIGGVDPRMLPDRELTILTDPPLFGVVAALPPHVMNAEDKEKTIPIEDLRIDIGYSQEKAQKLVPVGTPISFRKDNYSLGEDFYCGTSLDDRSCFAACMLAMELLQGRDLEYDVYILGATVEETSSAGALTGGFALDPDLVLVSDVCQAKTEDGGPANKDTCLGKGPSVCKGANCQPHLTEHILKLAEKHRIPYQIGASGGN
nr:M42 family peptidase [Clostridia bacterium]